MKICSRGKEEELQKQLTMTEVHSLLVSLIAFELRDNASSLIIGYLNALRQFNHIDDFIVSVRPTIIYVQIYPIQGQIETLTIHY